MVVISRLPPMLDTSTLEVALAIGSTREQLNSEESLFKSQFEAAHKHQADANYSVSNASQHYGAINQFTRIDCNVAFGA